MSVASPQNYVTHSGVASPPLKPIGTRASCFNPSAARGWVWICTIRGTALNSESFLGAGFDEDFSPWGPSKARLFETIVSLPAGEVGAHCVDDLQGCFFGGGGGGGGGGRVLGSSFLRHCLDG